MTMRSDPPDRPLDLQHIDLSSLALGTGSVIEVWCASLSEWVRGFAVHDVSDEGILVTRLSDGVVLPEPFAATNVRSAVGAGSRSPSWH